MHFHCKFNTNHSFKEKIIGRKMRLKKREIPNSRREMNVQEGDGVKKRESPS